MLVEYCRKKIHSVSICWQLVYNSCVRNYGGWMLPINKTISMIERYNLKYRNQMFKQYGLHGYQASFLLEIVRNPNISQDQLTKNMHLDKSNIARGCHALAKKGYIEINQDESDRRFVQLKATPQGHALSKIIIKILKNQRAFLMQDFDEADEAEFLKYLDWLEKRAIALLERE